jgi:hypothetical protein
VNSSFASQALDQSAQVLLAAVKQSRLSPQLSKFIACFCRVLAKSCDLDLLLVGLSAKPRKLPRIFRHKLKIRNGPPSC